jgi:TolB protein
MRILCSYTLFFISLSWIFAQPTSENKAPVIETEKESRYLQNIQQITLDGEKNGEAYFSTDQKKMVFQSVRGENPWYQIYTMNIDGTGLLRISPGKGKTTCAYFHPQKDQLLFASTHLALSTWTEVPQKNVRYSWDFDPHMDIFVGDREGKNLVQLTHTQGYDAEGSYSPEGDWICFTSQRTGDLEIFVMDAHGRQVSQITHTPGYDGGSFFSPDGKKIVFRAFRDAQKPRVCQVFLIDRDGKNEVQLTQGEVISWCPYFYPTGTHLVYSANLPNSHNFELFWISVEGGEPVRLTYSDTFDALPVFSSDGKKIMWTSNRQGNTSHVYIADFIPPASGTEETGNNALTPKKESKENLESVETHD